MENYVICLRIYEQINNIYNIIEEMKTLVPYIYKSLCKFRLDPVDISCKIYLIEYKNGRKKILNTLLHIEEESSELREVGYLNVLTDTIKVMSEANLPLETENLESIYAFDISTIADYDFVGDIFDIKYRVDAIRNALGEIKCEVEVKKLVELCKNDYV